MAEARRDPDALLAELKRSEAQARRGKLKIFFGAAPGVGKTYAMLEAARAEREAGVDVVIGVVETHGRDETRWLIDGLQPLDALPRRAIEYRGHVLHELDLDGALARRPQLLLVDELAHSNAEGSRHPKRWQDVLELLEAGIDVWTTVNVQHLESLNDVVAQVTHVRVRETVPDAVFERADQVELVDIPPDALLARLAEGKVYAGEAGARAAASFFKRGNLLALRELALRRTAERVDSDVLAWRRAEGISTAWQVAEHVLVAVGPSPVSADLVRAARRLASGLRARFTAATVETPASAPLSKEARARINRHLRLAEDLGAEIAVLSGLRPADALLEHARSHNVTRIVVGKPTHARWRDLVFGSLLDALVRGSGNIDVHVLRGDPETAGAVASDRPPPRPAQPAAMARAVLAVALATGVSFAMYGHFDIANLVMIYLLAIVLVAYSHGRAPAMVASVLSVAAFDLCFVPPRFTFSVSDGRYLVTFVILLLVGAVVSHLAERVRRQAEASRLRELRTHALFSLTRELASAKDARGVGEVLVRHLAAACDAQVTVLLGRAGRLVELRVEEASGGGEVQEPAPASRRFELDEREMGVAAWAFERGEAAGMSTTTLPGAKALYLPLGAGGKTLGVAAVAPADPARLEDTELGHLLKAFAQQAAVALARAELGEEARRAAVRAEREELLSSLLSSVSHDLRTPLAAITGAASTLLDEEAIDALDAGVRRDLLVTIQEESDRMNRLVANLLEMTRLESGSVVVRKEWTPLEEVVGSALDRLEVAMHGRPVEVRLPADLPLVPLDAVLMGQVFVNLLENAAKHTPPRTPVEVSARAVGDRLVVDVADRGPGIPAGAEERVFEKFYSGDGGRSSGGAGLGGAIVRGIVVAHGGAVSARNRPGGGALFRLELPLEGGPPEVPEESELGAAEERTATGGSAVPS